MRASVPRPDSRGFTLVELAVVITIIAMLTGGVLKGNEMIQRARISALITQIESSRAAVISFRDKFNQLPGDMANAVQRLPNCTASFHCANGNGNGLIEGAPAGTIDIAYVPGASEGAQAWKHLALADFLSAGFDVSADPVNPDDLFFGISHPSSPFRGGPHLVYIKVNVLPLQLNQAHYFYFRPTVTGRLGAANSYHFAGSLFISPHWAQLVDEKTDDAALRRGRIQALCFDPTAFGSILPNPDLKSTSSDCVLFAGAF